MASSSPAWTTPSLSETLSQTIIMKRVMNTAPRQSPQFNIQYQKEKKKKIRLKINYSGIELFRGPVELPSLDLRIAMLIYAHLLK